MGLLDQLGSMVGGAQGDQSGLMDSVKDLISGQEGGLGGLVEAFKQKGLGDVASSWVSTGENLPISAEQIQQVLGNEQVQQIASKLGIPVGDASQGLASMLPQVVDKLTPNGAIPEGGLMESALNLLKGKLFGS